MIKSSIHRFLLWAPTATAAGVVAVSAVWSGVANWFASKFTSVWAEITDPLTAVGILLATAVWALLVFFMAEKKPEYESIESKITEQRTSTDRRPGGEGSGPIAGRLQAQEEGFDTIEARGKTGITGLYVGNIVASASRLKEEHVLILALVGYNGSGEKVIFESLSGRIRAGTGNFRDMEELPPIALVKTVEAEAGQEFVINLEQPLTPNMTAQFLKEVEVSPITFDLDGLSIIAASHSDRGRRCSLPLWNAVNLRRRDELVSNRVTVLQAAAIRSTATVGSPRLAATKVS